MHLRLIPVALVLSTACSPETTGRAPADVDEPVDAAAAGGRGGRGGMGGSRPVGGSGGMAGAGPVGGMGGAAPMGGTGGSASADAAARDTSMADAATGDVRSDAGAAPDSGAGDRPDASGAADASPAVAFFQKECARCHGPEGQGTVLGPEIQHPVRDFATWVVRNGRKHPMFVEPMPMFTTEQLPAAQLDQILAFLSAPPKPTTGQALYVDFCANCHGANAKGGVTMRDITLPAVRTASVFITNVRGGHHAGEFANRREFMPKWTAAQLSDAEIRLVFGYVDGLAR